MLSLIPALLEGPRDHADNTAFGYAYDGGFMSPLGIPLRKIGTPTSTPGDFRASFSYFAYFLAPPDLSFNPLRFDFDKDIPRLNKSTPLVSYSTSTDISKFKNRGGKIIFYHGVSDPGPPVEGTIAYYEDLAARHGGVQDTASFARLFLIPGMGHCAGGPATDEFDALTPLVAWVEQGIAPERVIASGTRFTSAPAARSRPLCPYPQETRYVGAADGNLADASNYVCMAPK